MENESFIDEFKRYVADPKSRLLIFLGVAIFSVVCIVLVFVVINNNNSSNEITAAKKIEEDPAQKADILSQIVKNNPKASLNTNQSNATDTTTANPQDSFKGTTGYVAIDPSTGLPIGANNPAAVGPNEQPDLSKYNFRKTTEILAKGAFSDVCGYNYSYLSAGRYVSTEFFEPKNSYYVRKSEYEDGTLKGYFNSHYGESINESYSYAGGAYGVKEKYKNNWNDNLIPTRDITSYPVASYPTSYPQINQLIKNYFGYNATVQRVYQQANRTFYEIRSDYNTWCGENTNPDVAKLLNENQQLTIVNIYNVDAKTFEITNTKVYASSAIPANLIFSREYQVEYKLAAFSDVSSEFQIDYASEVRDVDHTTYVYSEKEYANRLANYLKDSSTNLIMPSNDVRVEYIFAKDTPPQILYSDYRKDRSYYTPGANGDKTYSESVRYYNYMPNLYYSLTTENGYYTYSFEKYGPERDFNTTLENLRRNVGGFGTTEFTKPIMIGNDSVDVVIRQTITPNYYSYYNYVTSYPISYIENLAGKYPTTSVLSYPASFPLQSLNGFYVNYQIVFEYKGEVYTGSVSGWAIDRFLSEPFQNIEAATQEGYNTFTNIVSDGVRGEFSVY